MPFSLSVKRHEMRRVGYVTHEQFLPFSDLKTNDLKIHRLNNKHDLINTAGLKMCSTRVLQLQD